MGGWLWIILGALLYGVNAFPPYQRWALQRLKNKKVPGPEQKLSQRKKALNILASIYILAGIALWFSQF